MSCLRGLTGILFCTALLCISQNAGAHAAPVLYIPAASSTLAVPPTDISIRFSERIEPAATTVTVFAPDGNEIPKKAVVVSKDDPRTLHLPVTATATGSYAVSWNTVSADDGHFTKGAFVYSVGSKSINANAGTGDSFEIQHETDTAQAVTIWLELLGQAILLAFFVLHTVMRKSVSADLTLQEKERYAAGWPAYVYTGAILILTGTASYFLLKSQTIAIDQQKTLMESAWIFLQTNTGGYAAARLAIAGLFLILFATRKKAITLAQSLTVTEGILFTLLLVSILLRARISHAAASGFLPALSVVINWIHLVSKHLWIGGLVILVCVWLPVLQLRKDAKLYGILLTAFSRLLTYSLVTGGLTGLYIIWLHLKDLRNISGSHWGMQFEGLAIFAVILLSLRLYSSLSIDRAFVKTAEEKTEAHADTYKSLWYALTLEMIAGLGVLYLSSVLIITTPPLPITHTYTQTAVSQKTAVTFGEHPYAEDSMLVTATPDPKENTVTNMVVTLTNAARGIGPIEATLMKEFDGGYRFQRAELSPAGEWTIHITAIHTRGYDAVATFSMLYPDAIDASHKNDGKHRFGFFETIISISALLLILLSLFLFRTSNALHRRSLRTQEYITTMPSMHTREFAILTGTYCILFLFLGSLVSGHHNGSFQTLCEENGHEWHESVPVRAGEVTSPVSVMGCMFGSGSGQYHFADERAYGYFMKSGQVRIAP